MLDTLRALDPVQAEAVLCRAVDAFLPTVDDIQLGELERRVIDEARHVAGGDDSKVEEILGQELMAFALSERDEVAARGRLGDKGDLPLTDYTLRFDTSFDGGEFLGFTIERAVEVIRSPDIVEHIVTSAPTDGNVTLLASYVPVHRTGRHWDLLVGGRSGDRLRVVCAWHVYVDDIALPPVITSGRELLFAFAAKFGKEFIVSGSRKARMLWRDRSGVTSLAATGTTADFSISFHAAGEVILAFSIDTVRYAHALARRGIAMGKHAALGGPIPGARSRFQGDL